MAMNDDGNNNSSTQTGYIPMETVQEGDDNDEQNESNIDRFLPIPILFTSQSCSLLPFNDMNMIPSQTPSLPCHPSTNLQQINNQAQVLENRRLRRRRARQRRRERQRQERQYYRTYRYYDSDESLTNELTDMNELLLDVYNILRDIDPQAEAREQWEQEQLMEYEGFIVLEQLAFIQDEIDQLEQIDRIQWIEEENQQILLNEREQDESNEILHDPNFLDYISKLEDTIVQLKQIDDLDSIDREIAEEKKEERNHEELIRLEQWEHMSFEIQQLNQN